MLKTKDFLIQFYQISESQVLLRMADFCGIQYTTSKQQRDFIVLDTTQSHRCYTQRMACISKYGLHVETITFPRGLQQAKTGKSGGEGDKKTMAASKKWVPATDISTHGKM